MFILNFTPYKSSEQSVSYHVTRSYICKVYLPRDMSRITSQPNFREQLYRGGLLLVRTSIIHHDIGMLIEHPHQLQSHTPLQEDYPRLLAKVTHSGYHSGLQGHFLRWVVLLSYSVQGLYLNGDSNPLHCADLRISHCMQ